MTTQNVLTEYSGQYDQKIAAFAKKINYFAADNVPSNQLISSTIPQSYGSIIDVHALRKVGTRGTRISAENLT